MAESKTKMATKYKTRGFVFRKYDRSEFDQSFSVFTQNFGRLELNGRAIRKTISKLRANVDLFFLSELEFIQGRNAKTLTDVKALEKFNNIFQDLDRFKMANKIGEIFDSFVRGQEKDENLFDLLTKTFVELNNVQIGGFKLQVLYYYFLWSALSYFGYCPEVQKCNVCRQKLNPYSVYFSDKLGGAVCKKCLAHDGAAVKINSDIIKILRLIFEKKWEIIRKLKIEPNSHVLFQKISDNYYLYILSSHSFN